jgi:hypothetical protein
MLVWQEDIDGRAVPTLVWTIGVWGLLPTEEDVLKARDNTIANINVQPERIDLSAANGARWFGMEVVA